MFYLNTFGLVCKVVTLESNTEDMLGKAGVKGFSTPPPAYFWLFDEGTGLCWHTDERKAADNTDIIKKKKNKQFGCDHFIFSWAPQFCVFGLVSWRWWWFSVLYPFQHDLVILRWRKGDNERLSAMKCHTIRSWIPPVCLCWGFTAQSTQWGHVESGQFT